MTSGIYGSFFSGFGIRFRFLVFGSLHCRTMRQVRIASLRFRLASLALGPHTDSLPGKSGVSGSDIVASLRCYPFMAGFDRVKSGHDDIASRVQPCRWIGSIQRTSSGRSTGSMSRLTTTVSLSLRTRTHSSVSSVEALISWCGT